MSDAQALSLDWIEKLTPERRREIAVSAITARWDKYRERIAAEKLQELAR